MSVPWPRAKSYRAAYLERCRLIAAPFESLPERAFRGIAALDLARAKPK